MLTRRYLRIKVLQELYAFSRNYNADFAKAEQKLTFNINKIYDLYIFQLAYLIEIRDFEEARQEEAKQKYYPTDEDLNPNTKFIENEVLKKIEENNTFKRLYKKLKVNFGEKSDMVRHSLNLIKESEVFKNYMASGKFGFEEDRKALLKIITEILPYDETLISHYEDQNVNWVNDYDASLILLEKTIRYLKRSDDEFTTLPSLYNQDSDERGKNVDEEFVKKLFRDVVFNQEELDEIIKKRTERWDFDRVALLDIILIRMAITEFLHFDTIPVKVTINEYIELSKIFSTPKSSIFVNGLLDKIKIEFLREDKINKIGRGLIND
ncbi:MAG TPA: transcription antitermination protein NusB [Bacteroidales bacterium]|nr:transcription antitermination protein NusB [Bacteroidales bacterium]